VEGVTHDHGKHSCPPDGMDGQPSQGWQEAAEQIVRQKENSASLSLYQGPLAKMSSRVEMLWLPVWSGEGSWCSE